MGKYDYILFDWDGCLAKTLDILLNTYKNLFAELNIYPDNNTIIQEVFGDWNGPKKLGVRDIENFSKKFVSNVDKSYQKARLNDGVEETLKILKMKGKKMALITTALQSTIMPALENNNIEGMFEVVLTGNDVTKHKPDPEMIYKAVKLLNGTMDQSIIVGDSKSDLGAGNNAGVDTLLYYPKINKMFYEIEFLKKYNPNFIINDFCEIIKVVT